MKRRGTAQGRTVIPYSAGNRSLLLIVAFLGVILATGLYMLCVPVPEFSEMENRKPASAAEFSLQTLLSGEYMDSLEAALSDNAPFREQLVLTKAGLSRNIAQLAYLPTLDAAIPVFDSSEYLLWRDKGVLIPPPAIEYKNLYSIIDKRIEQYQEVLNVLPNLNLCVYDIMPREYSVFNPTMKLYNGVVERGYMDYFAKNLPNGLSYFSMEMDSEEKFLSYYYKTDIHWAAEGAWQGYQDCAKLLGISSPVTLSAIEPVKEVAEYRGSLAANAAYTGIYDKLTEIIPNESWRYTTLVNGKNSKRGARQTVLAENRIAGTNIFANHYGWYFGGNFGLVEYLNEGAPEKGSLLIIGSSFTNCIEYLFSYSYAHVYVVDLREYEEDQGAAFNMTEFCREHEIDDVLMLARPKENYLDAKIWSILN